MKNKFIVAILFVVILFLTGNTYRLQQALDKQRTISTQQTDLVDSLQKEIELRLVKAQDASARSQLILARTKYKLDSVNALKKTNQKK